MSTSHVTSRKVWGLAVALVALAAAPLAVNPATAVQGASTSAFAVPEEMRQEFPDHNVLVVVGLGSDRGETTVTVAPATPLPLSELQPVPVGGWALAHLGDRLQFTHPAATGTASFLVRVTGDKIPPFAVDVVRVSLPSLLVTRTAGVVDVQTPEFEKVLQMMPVVRDATTGELSPAPVLLRDDLGRFEAGLLVATYDRVMREYVAPDAACLTVRLTPELPAADHVTSGDAALVLTATNGAFGEGAFDALLTPEMPLVAVNDAAVLADLLPTGASVSPVRATFVPLTGAAAAPAVAEWVARHPEPLRVWASCESSSRDLVLSDLVTPLLNSGPASLLVAPAGVDADADGFASLNEVRGGSMPHLAASTPFTDDDGDGVPNGRDLNPWFEERSLIAR